MTTTQQYFDNAVGGILRQGRFAVNESGKCKYRVFNGKQEVIAKCAIGHCIRDWLYKEKMDNPNMGTSEVLYMAGITDTRHDRMLHTLQAVHDSCSGLSDGMKRFIADAKVVCTEYKLSDAVFDNFASMKPSW